MGCRAFLALCVFCLPLSAQIPDAPVPQHDQIRQGALNLTVSERYQILAPMQAKLAGQDIPGKQFFETTGGLTFDWRFFTDKVRAGLGYSYSLSSGNQSIGVMANYKLLRFGKLR